MQLKVLENSGTLTSASDGVTVNWAISSNQEGRVIGRYKNFNIYQYSNYIEVQSGHYICHGINLILEEDQIFNITPTSELSGWKYLGIFVEAGEDNTLTATLGIYDNFISYTFSLVHGNYQGHFFVLLGEFKTNSSGIVNWQNLETSFKPYPELYEYLIFIDDHNYEGGIVNIAFNVTTTMPDLDGMTLDDFISPGTYLGYGYVQSSSSSSAYYEGSGMFFFNWGEQGESGVEDYRGGSIRYTLMGNENYVVKSRRPLN